MPPTAENIREVAGVDPRALPAEVLESTEPLVLRGLAAHWPMVRRRACESPRMAADYLLGFLRRRHRRRDVSEPRRSKGDFSTTRIFPASISAR